jgi:A/G-specific adenine glycosylase
MLNVQRRSALSVGRWALDVGRLLRIVMTRQNLPAFRRSLVQWFRRHGRDLPWRRTTDPYRIVVSEFMLQQTQVTTVIPYYNQWLRRFPNFLALARASETDVLRAWQGLGYYARARNLHATATAIVNGCGGRFPRSIEQMQQLPGIGKYTAHAIASFAFDQPAPIVEANTARVLSRLFNRHVPVDSNAGRTTLWNDAAMLVPKSNVRMYNSALTDLGALICLPRKAKCDICPVEKFCDAKDPEALPVRRPRLRVRRLRENHALMLRQGKMLLEQSSTRWRGMWILPRLQTKTATGRPIYTSAFPFTHHQVELVVYPLPAPKQLAPDQRWFVSIDHIPMPSPHRRAAAYFLDAANIR